jgi:catalase
MPLPVDEKLLALSNDILQQFETIFGQHPGFALSTPKARC